MTIAYPDGVPKPLHSDYGTQHVNPLMRTELSSGRARQRRRFTSVPSMASVSWVMTRPQAIIFEAWYKYTLLDGAEWFDAPLTTPLGVGDYEARFTGIYDGPKLIGKQMWTFTAQLEIRERQVIGQDWYEILPEYILDMDIFDIAMNREMPLA